MALYSIPAVDRDTLLVSLYSKQMIVSTVPLADCPALLHGEKPQTQPPSHLVLTESFLLCCKVYNLSTSFLTFAPQH